MKVARGDPFVPQSARAAVREGMHTTHLTASDWAGNVVAYTFTIESWGSNGITVPELVL